jgi:hypothetical protein
MVLVLLPRSLTGLMLRTLEMLTSVDDEYDENGSGVVAKPF